MESLIQLQNITKTFPGIVANDKISLELRKGEVLALLGENGAGKSTLMSILFGLYTPDSGDIYVRGKLTKIHDPTAAMRLGIGMVHQHFKLVHNFTVAENIVLGAELTKGPFLSRREAERRVKEISERHGLNVDPGAKIEDISVGMQQRVEILKMLYRDAEILIFDEPSAVLTPQEIHELMNIIRSLVKEGKSVFLITHKLREIKEIADRCVVIRRGKVIGTVDVATTSSETMAEMMVGRSVSFSIDKPVPSADGKEVLRIDNLSALSRRKTLALDKVSFTLQEGEILGIAGVEGNGQTELVEVLSGLRKQTEGSIFLYGKDISHASIHDRIEAGLGHIPEDRQKRGLVLDYTLAENFILQSHGKAPYSERGLLKPDAIKAQAERVSQEFDVRSGEGIVSIARTLSGGNQQKAIVGRELDRNPGLLIAVQPTRGLDVGSIEYIHNRLIEQRSRHSGILLVSLELDELLKLSDRIAVLSHGRIVGILEAKDFDEQRIGLMMTGISHAEAS